jgi:hypothetical protein
VHAHPQLTYNNLTTAILVYKKRPPLHIAAVVAAFIWFDRRIEPLERHKILLAG